MIPQKTIDEMIQLLDKTITVRLTEDELEKLNEIAHQDCRASSTLVRLLIINLIRGDLTITTCVKNNIEK